MELERRLESLSRQGSLYSLSVDEIQNQMGGGLGKGVGSMNVDELLRNVWNTNGWLSLDSSSGTLNRQGSFSVSRDVSKKTVEEVWKEIEQGKKKGDRLGEMTVEDLLVKGGVVGESQWMMNCQLAQQQQQRVFLGVEQPLGEMSMIDAVSGPGGQKRGVVVERRQKRMIKNRESPARSRARKQLENKVSRLEEERRQHNKEVEKVLPSSED